MTIFVYSVVCNSLLIFESYLSFTGRRSSYSTHSWRCIIQKFKCTAISYCATASLNIISVCKVQVQVSHLRNNYGMLLKNEGSQTKLFNTLFSLLFKRNYFDFVYRILYSRYTLWYKYCFSLFHVIKKGGRILKRSLIIQIYRFSSCYKLCDIMLLSRFI